MSVDSQHAKAAVALRADPRIAGYTRGGFTNVRIGSVGLMALVLGGSGPARPVITAGVPPAAADEVALGASTMRAAHTAIGRTVDLVLDLAKGHPKPAPVRMRVVGTVIVPPNPFLATNLGQGAAVALPGFLRIDPSMRQGALPFLVRFAPGVSRNAGLAAITRDLKGLPNPFVAAAERPANVVSLARIAGVPILLSGLLALIAAGTLAHTLVSSTRGRRHDLAILKSLGFVRRQVWRAIAWQATTIVAIALLIGLPIGIAGGRGRGASSPCNSAFCPTPSSRSSRSSSPFPAHWPWRTSSQRLQGRQQRARRPAPSSGASKETRQGVVKLKLDGPDPPACDATLAAAVAAQATAQALTFIDRPGRVGAVTSGTLEFVLPGSGGAVPGCPTRTAHVAGPPWHSGEWRS